MDLAPVELGKGTTPAEARRAVRAATTGWDDDLVFQAELVVTELVTNAMLHGGGVGRVVVSPRPADGNGGGHDEVYLEVADHSRHVPLVAVSSTDAMTGRGLHLIAQLSSDWGVELAPGGKILWARVGGAVIHTPEQSEMALLETWGDPFRYEGELARVHVALGEVPTELLVAAKRHVDNLVREFALAASGERSGTTEPVPAPLAELIETVVHRFEDARLEIKRRATAAARQGAERVTLDLDLPLDAARAAQQYVAALDEVDAYCRANRLLTLETPPQHRVFRRWYVEEIVTQLRALEAGETPPRPTLFETRLLQEVDAADRARRVAERAARLYHVAVSLAAAITPEEVAEAVLRDGVDALGASGGGVLLAGEADRLAVPATVGYAEPIVEQLRQETADANLPAASALRTGEPVWLETQAERDERFPGLAGVEPDTAAMCAVPVRIGSRVFGALRFSFRESRLFDEDERRFVLALAAETAEALRRAELLEEQAQIAAVLQQSLLPGELPSVPGVDIGAVYLTGGQGVGGDFYDIFPLEGGRWGVGIGDVRGRGPQAAALTSLARYTIRTAALLGREPAEVLEVLNGAMHDDEADNERFCSAVFGVLDIDEDGGTLTMASAGHPPVAVIRAGVVSFVAATGTLAGITADATYGEEALRLGSGDAVVFYTDGVSEARGGEGAEFGDRRLATVLSELGDVSAQAVAAELVAEARAFAAQPLNDDAAVFVVRIE